MNITELSQKLRDGGVVGAGGAGFPSYAKLNENADTIILNCAECEPLLRLHRQLLALHTEEILTALDTVAEAVGADNIIVAVKPSYKKAVEAVKSALPSHPKARIGLLPEAYPSGDEVVTIYETTGRVVGAGKLPISVGVIVYNVETMFNAYHAIKGEGVSSKYITVTGAVKAPVTLKVPLGVTYAEVIKAAGGATVKDFALVGGGPMTGPLVNENDVVTKTSNAVIVLPADHHVVTKKSEAPTVSVHRVMAACCQCHYCTDLCPRHLLGSPIDPARLMRAFASGNTADSEAFLNSNFCCGCDLCTMFSCFQGLSPSMLIGKVRGELRKNGVRPPEAVMHGVSEQRSGRLIPVERLVERLGLAEYNVDAPFVDREIEYDKVKIMLSQHIGVPASAAVKQGDAVNKGDVIGTAAEGKLSVAIHSSISGTVTEVNDRYVIVTRRKELD